MSGHVLAALPHPRATWPAELSRWATSGTAPVEFHTCLTANEVRARLASQRRPDAVLLDGASTQLNPELVVALVEHHSLPIGIDPPGGSTPWDSLGVGQSLPSDFVWLQLADILGEHCSPRSPGTAPRYVDMDPREESGALVAVSGAGGTGASCVAMGLASAAVDPHDRKVLLVDGARRGELAMYHDTGDVVPGLPELVKRARNGDADPDELDDTVFDSGRGYELLLGQRSTTDWLELDRSSVTAAIRATRRRWDVVVVDHDGDLDSSELTRSAETDARNAVSLELARSADLWVVVVAPGTKGIASAARAIDEAVRAGVEQRRIQVVFNRFGRSPVARGVHSGALASMTAARDSVEMAVYVPECRHMESAHRDATRLPRRFLSPLAAVLEGVVENGSTPSTGRRVTAAPTTEPATPDLVTTGTGAQR